MPPRLIGSPAAGGRQHFQQSESGAQTHLVYWFSVADLFWKTADLPEIDGEAKAQVPGTVQQEGIHPIKGPFVGLQTDHPLGISTVVIDYGEEPNGEQLHEMHLEFLEPRVFQTCTAQVGYTCVESKLPVSIQSIYQKRSAVTGELVAEAGIQGEEALHHLTVPVDRDSEAYPFDSDRTGTPVTGQWCSTRSGRVPGNEPRHPPTPPDVPFSVSGG